MLFKQLTISAIGIFLDSITLRKVIPMDVWLELG